MSATNSLHYELCKLGAKFLMSRKNAEHWHTPNKFAVVELICQGAENPDIWATNGMYTTLVEVKTSRSDFLADKRKYVRSKDAEEQDMQLGNFRYYLCPAGVISVEDLPENWGLLEYDGKKIYKIQAAKQVKSSAPFEISVMSSIMTRILRPQIFNFRERTDIKLIEK